MSAHPTTPKVRGALSTREAADYLGLCIRTLQHYAQQGLIPHQRVGKKYLFSETALRRWLEQGRVPPDEQRIKVIKKLGI